MKIDVESIDRFSMGLIKKIIDEPSEYVDNDSLAVLSVMVGEVSGVVKLADALKKELLAQ